MGIGAIAAERHDAHIVSVEARTYQELLDRTGRYAQFYARHFSQQN